MLWSDIGVGKQETDCLQSSQNNSDFCPSTGLTSWLRTLPDWSRQFGLCYGYHPPISTVHKGWQVASSDILQQVFISGGTKLWDPQQGDACYHPCTRRVEAFPGRSSQPGRDLDGLQELGIFHDCQKAKPPASMLVSLPSKIWFHPLLLTWTIHGETRHLILETSLWQRILWQWECGIALSGVPGCPYPRRSRADRSRIEYSIQSLQG